MSKHNDKNSSKIKVNPKFSYEKIQPAQELEQIVKYAWIMKSHEAVRSDLDLLIPDGYPEIIFVLNGVYYKENIVTNKEIIIRDSCVVGIQNQSVLASRGNNCHLLGLKLYPWGAYRIFGDKLSLIANKNVSIKDFGIEWLCELNDRLAEHKEESTMVEFLFNTLSQQIELKDDDESWKTPASYLQTILEMDGQISVQDLAQRHCLSIRHFQRKFKQYYGLSPKKFINIIRFKKLYKSSVLQKKLPENFLAYGYYDQTHFIKDFYKQLKITPSKATEKAFLRLNGIAKINSKS